MSARIFDAEQIERDLAFVRLQKRVCEALFNSPELRAHIDESAAMQDFMRLNQIESRVIGSQQGAIIERTLDDLEDILRG